LKTILIACFAWQAGTRDWKLGVFCVIGILVSFLLGTFFDRKWMVLPFLPLGVLAVAVLLGLHNPDFVLSNKEVFVQIFRLIITIPIIGAVWIEISKLSRQSSCA
jgi:hypothetical protein